MGGVLAGSRVEPGTAARDIVTAKSYSPCKEPRGQTCQERAEQEAWYRVMMAADLQGTTRQGTRDLKFHARNSHVLCSEIEVFLFS